MALLSILTIIIIKFLCHFIKKNHFFYYYLLYSYSIQCYSKTNCIYKKNIFKQEIFAFKKMIIIDYDLKNNKNKVSLQFLS